MASLFPSKALLFLTTMNVGLGLVLQFACILVLGAGHLTDAYFSAQVVPALVGAVLTGAIANNLTPMVAGIPDDAGRAGLIFEAMLKYGALAFAVFGGLAVLVPFWINVLFQGLPEEAASLAVKIAPVVCLIAAVQFVSVIPIAGHHVQGRFVFVEGVQVTTILVALLFVGKVIETAGILGFVWLLAVRSLVVWIAVGSRFWGAARTQEKRLMSSLWARSIQVVTFSTAFKLGPIIDRMLASFSSSGILTSLAVGQQIVGASLSVSERVFARPLMVSAGGHHAKGQVRDLISAYHRQLAGLFATIGAALIVAGLGVAAILLLGRSADWTVRQTMRLDLIFWVLVTAIPSAAGQLSSTLMYAVGEIQTLNRLATFSFITSNAVKIFGFWFFGPYAIVGGMFLYQFINWVSLHMAAMRKLQTSEHLSAN